MKILNPIRILFLKRLFHHKSGFTFSIIIYNLIIKLFDLLLFEGSYLMRPEDRAVVSYEPNLFYRHLIHAYGAPGLAMTRIVKSDDDELEEIAEDFLLFHDEIPDEETMGLKISFEDITPTLDSDSKFSWENSKPDLTVALNLFASKKNQLVKPNRSVYNY